LNDEHKELRKFTDDLLSLVEELRGELKNYGSVSLGREVLIFTIVKNFLKDVHKIKEQRFFHNTEDE
tara:strand:+ start:98 stop:298 length:201 start_codon:yes stop_codon:yes gene_type:complete